MKYAASQSDNFNNRLRWLPISSLSTLSLQLLVKKMKRSLSWFITGLNTTILLNNQEKQIVLTVLRRNTEIVSNQENDSITFKVIEGSLKLESKNRTVFINKGRVLTLKEKEEYTLSNSEETAYLLTMVNKN